MVCEKEKTFMHSRYQPFELKTWVCKYDADFLCFKQSLVTVTGGVQSKWFAALHTLSPYCDLNLVEYK
jgi:hypothetical protein